MKLGSNLMLAILGIMGFTSLGKAGELEASQWSLTKTSCENQLEQQVKIVKGLLISNFQPHVRLEFIGNLKSKDGSLMGGVRKVVTQNSCGGPQIASPKMLMYSDYGIRKKVTASSPMFEEGFFVSTGLLRSQINRMDLLKCDLEMGAVSFLIFPEHFEKEADRFYAYRMEGHNLTLAFDDREICPDARTVMTFRRVISLDK